ncbi:hypothetical protein LTR17_000016 [Elasticomyces elasticus]|nr:hypothetical protein LTR17_000016 [Elasticomyces elasticus]
MGGMPTHDFGARRAMYDVSPTPGADIQSPTPSMLDDVATYDFGPTRAVKKYYRGVGGWKDILRHLPSAGIARGGQGDASILDRLSWGINPAQAQCWVGWVVGGISPTQGQEAHVRRKAQLVGWVAGRISSGTCPVRAQSVEVHFVTEHAGWRWQSDNPRCVELSYATVQGYD